MRFLFTFVAAALLTLSADAGLLNEGKYYNVTEAEPELVYHTAAPGMILMPRSDTNQMVMAYDLTLIPREGMAFVRWGHLDENGEGEGYWTKWRDYDGVISFTIPGRYVLETHAEATGKDNSSTLKASFKVDYLGMTTAPGISLIPVDQRGYNVSLTSLFEYDIYYRWRHYDDGTWSKWRLYTEPISFTEAGTYVLEANCEGDPLSVYIEVPSVDYYKTGDVNHNGIVSIDDVTALIDMLLNNDYLIGTGDVNKDGAVSIQDVTELIDILLKEN